MLDTVNPEVPIRKRLLKLANDLPLLAKAKSKPGSVVLAEAKARLRAREAIEELVEKGLAIPPAGWPRGPATGNSTASNWPTRKRMSDTRTSGQLYPDSKVSGCQAN